MKEILSKYFMENRILSITLIAWAFTQTIKVTLGVIREKKFNFSWFIGTGGCLSSHAAGATAMAISSGLELGFSSPIFALAFVFAMVTMFDARGCAGPPGNKPRF